MTRTIPHGWWLCELVWSRWKTIIYLSWTHRNLRASDLIPRYVFNSNVPTCSTRDPDSILLYSIITHSNPALEIDIHLNTTQDPDIEYCTPMKMNDLALGGQRRGRPTYTHLCWWSQVVFCHRALHFLLPCPCTPFSPLLRYLGHSKLAAWRSFREDRM